MQDKRSKKELTRLILAALILGGGCLYGPVAEATDYTIDNNVGKTTSGITGIEGWSSDSES